MYCLHCGVFNHDTCPYCTQCGMALPVLVDESPQVQPRSWVRPKPMSKQTHMIASFAALITPISVFVYTLSFHQGREPQDHSMSLVLLLGGGLIYAIIRNVQLYKFWAAIQDGEARTSPGGAMGNMFIPFYYCLWIFQAVHGLAQDHNAFLDRHGFQWPHLDVDLHLHYCILHITGFGLILSEFIWIFAILPQNIEAVNRLAKAPEPVTEPASAG